MENNTNSSKTIGIVIIVAIVVIGVWLMTKKSKDVVVEQVPAATTPAATPKDDTDPMVSGIQSSGTSNAALDSDSAVIDTEIEGFSTDNASAQSAVE